MDGSEGCRGSCDECGEELVCPTCDEGEDGKKKLREERDMWRNAHDTMKRMWAALAHKEGTLSKEELERIEEVSSTRARVKELQAERYKRTGQATDDPSLGWCEADGADGLRCLRDAEADQRVERPGGGQEMGR